MISLNAKENIEEKKTTAERMKIIPNNLDEIRESEDGNSSEE